MSLKPFKNNFFIFFESRILGKDNIFFEYFFEKRGVREPKGREDRCDKKESREKKI